MDLKRWLAAVCTVTAAAVAVTPAPASADAVTLCVYEITRVHAVNQYEPRGYDEIYFRLNDQRFPNHGGTKIKQGETFAGGAWGGPRVTSSLPAVITMWEYDALSQDEPLGGTTLPCAALAETPFQIIRTPEVEYVVWIRVIVQQI
jgi:hypothetical protein